MAAIDSLFGAIRVHIRDCPAPAMSDAIVEIAREFCAYTRCVRETILLDAVKDLFYYPLAPEVTLQTEVVGVHAVEFDGEPIDPRVQEGIDHSNEGPEEWVYEFPDQLRLFGPPLADLDDGISVRLILQPTLAATALPDALLRKYRRDIADGTIAYLASMTKAGWYAPELVKEFGPKYRKSLDHARTDADRDNGPRNFRVRPCGP